MTIFEKLIANLEELTKNYRQLLNCVRKEKDLLIKTDLNALDENTVEKENLVYKIKALDALRINYAIEMAASVGLDTQNVRLLDIAQKLNGEKSDRLRSLHGVLDLIIRRLSELNKENEKYAQSALQTVQSAMGSFKDALMGQKTYQSKGQYQQGHDRSGHLVRREA
jgi:FlgN protein